MKTSGKIRRFLPYYRKYWGILLLDLFCASLTTLCELVLPMIVRRITDAATTDIALLTVSLIAKCGILYLVLRIIDTAAYYYMATVGHVMGTRIETELRRDMFDHLMKLPFSYYDNAKVGTLMSRITNDLFDVTEFAHHCPEEFFIAGIKIIASFSILCTMNVWLTLIVFATIPPMILILSFFNRRMRAGFRESRKKVAELNSQVEDSLLGIRVVKSFANEEIEQAKFEKGNQGFLAIKKKVYRYMGGFQSTTRLFDGIMYIIIVVVGALFLRNGTLTTPDFMAYLLFVSTLLNSIRRIVEFAEQFQRGMTGIERFFEVMDVEPSIVNTENAKELTSVSGDIRFKDVTFRYSSENEEVLHHMDLTIEPGKCVALVGPSGGGKTTISALIPRFYDIQDGTVEIDGVDIRDLSLESLRNNIGIVQQDVYLFSGSVYENIAYGKPGATQEEIREAAILAGADEFIRGLPNGYDTYVGERGVKLSGGQKQRISIARVFLKNPPILILDEATSALDNESERLVQQSLSRLAKGRTTLIIAHRLTTIKNADKIIVIGDNGIVEQGSHHDLMAKKNAYYELYNTYTTE
ncbi:MAG: ABC transporter ATP-binding protein [Clostridia bacterium]|nr:ABC transporter ATP-binding protein [Clostridia bacterium]